MDGAWFVRAAEGGTAFATFRDNGIVAIGWKEIGAVAATDPDEKTDALFASTYPDEKKGAHRVRAGQLRRFLREPAKGDRVLTYDPQSRIYLLGNIASDALWVPDSDLPRVRRVTWEREVPRDILSASTRNTLGAIQAVYRVDADAARELWERSTKLGAAPAASVPPIADVEAASDPTEALERDKTISQSAGLIEDRIMRLSPDEIPELFAGILRAMGYKTKVSKPGPDRGVDVFASPDGLGLQEPRIFVEVKHRSAAMGAPELRSFLGGRKPGDRCIYVSTGGFSKEAKYEADRSSIPLSLVDLERLRELLVDHYEKLDAATRSLVPLVRIYWPVE